MYQNKYGPEDGLQVDTEQFEITPGGDPVGMVYGSTPGVGPLATWGTSYAISEEVLYLYYEGRAKAAANVYDGLRIIQVCFWYSRGGVKLTSDVCSLAYSTGSSWVAGPEAVGGAWDTLDPTAPPTIFNIQTTRINPNVY